MTFFGFFKTCLKGAAVDTMGGSAVRCRRKTAACVSTMQSFEYLNPRGAISIWGEWAFDAIAKLREEI
jgi:hypothetical protein